MARKYIYILLSILIVACSGAEDRKSSYLEKGDQLFEQGNYDKAQLEYKNALQIDPKDATAHFKLAQTAENLNNWRPAVQHYLAVLQLDENHVEARIKLAQIYLLGGLREKASAMIEEALTLDLKNADALAVRGGIALQNDAMDIAQQNADAAFEVDSNNNLAKSLQVAIYLRANEVDNAIALVKQGIENDPNNVTQKLLLADIYARNGKFEEALNPIKALIVQSPDVLAYRIQQVTLLTKLDRIDEAESEIQKSLKDFNANSDVKLLLVKFLAQYRNQEAAENQLKEFVKSDPNDLKIKLALGDYYVSQKDIGSAKKLYLSIVEENEESLESLNAHKKLARIDFKTGDEESALQHIEQILERNPTDPDGLVLRGANALAKKDATSAVADFRAILKDKPNDINVLRLLAYAYLINEQPDLAKEAIQQAVKFDADNSELQLIYAQLLSKQGDRDVAHDMLNELIASEEGNAQALKVLFDLQVVEKDWDGAISTAEKMQLSQPESALPEYMMGLLFDAKGSSSEAEAQYLAALKKQPDAVEPLTALTKHYVANKNFEKAHSLLDTTIKNNSKNVVAYNLKAEVAVNEGKTKDAEIYFNAAINKQPAWWIPYRGLAALMIAQNNDAQAIDIYATGIKNGADIERLGVDRALLFEKNKAFNEAKKQYEEIIEKKEDANLAANNLAMLLINYFTKKEEFNRAGELVEKFSTSNDPAYLDTYGWVQLKLGNKESAILALEKTVSLAPKASELRYHLGIAYADNNEKEKAIEELQTALESGQKFIGIELAKARLDELVK